MLAPLRQVGKITGRERRTIHSWGRGAIYLPLSPKCTNCWSMSHSLKGVEVPGFNSESTAFTSRNRSSGSMSEMGMLRQLGRLADTLADYLGDKVPDYAREGRGFALDLRIRTIAPPTTTAHGSAHDHSIHATPMGL